MKVSRRDFIKKAIRLGSGAVIAGALTSLIACEPETPPSSPQPQTPSASPSAGSKPSTAPAPTPPPTSGAYLAVARGATPTAMVEAVVKALGGIERFVKTGDDVIVKPNICVAYHTYEYAATTNPEVVGAVVKLCLAAGAKRVRVLDQPFGGTAEKAYEISGIAEAVKAAGGQMELMSNMKFRDTPIPDGRDIKTWPVYADALDADVLINIPIAKHHSLARLTLGMKNLMGLIQNRGQIHFNIGQRLADLASLIKPDLTIIDGVRILMNHGPTGGDLDDVKLANTVIASQDIIAADAYAATLFGLTGADIPYIRLGAQMGLGTMDLDNIKIEEISV